MIYMDPTHEILKAYVNVLKGSIIYDGVVIPVGTRIPRRATEYVLIYKESLENVSTGDKVVYLASVAMQVVSMQDISEGDETPVNRIMEQIIEVMDPEMFIMNHFKCITAMPAPDGMDRDTELTDNSYNIIRILRMLNFIEQTR
jgi:hypothetical protein